MSKKEGDAAHQGGGTPGFVKRHELHTDGQRASADAVAAEIRKKGLRTVRVVIVDQHGIPRTKFLSAQAAVAARNPTARHIRAMPRPIAAMSATATIPKVPPIPEPSADTVSSVGLRRAAIALRRCPILRCFPRR